MAQSPESLIAQAGDKSLTLRGNVGITLQVLTLLAVAYGAMLISNILENQRGLKDEFDEIVEEFKGLEEQAVLSFKADEQLLSNVLENRKDLQVYLLKYAEDTVTYRELLLSIDRSDKDILRLVETALFGRYAPSASGSRQHPE